MGPPPSGPRGNRFPPQIRRGKGAEGHASHQEVRAARHARLDQLRRAPLGRGGRPEGQQADARVLLDPQHRLHQPAHLQGHRCLGGPRRRGRRQASLLATPEVPRLPRPGHLRGSPRVPPAKPQACRLRAPAAARARRAHRARPAGHADVDARVGVRGHLHLVPAAAGAPPHLLLHR
ncbi:hypothetical protein VPH35_038586 [Triticum aestivum]